MPKKQNSIPTTHPKPKLPILPPAQIPVPSEYRSLLLAALHQQQTGVRQTQALQEQLKNIEQQVLDAHGQLTGLVKGLVILLKADPAATWDLSQDCSHLIKR